MGDEGTAERIYTEEEAATILGMSVSMLQKRRRGGKIGHVKDGRQYIRYFKHHLEEYLSRHGTGRDLSIHIGEPPLQSHVPEESTGVNAAVVKSPTVTSEGERGKAWQPNDGVAQRARERNYGLTLSSISIGEPKGLARTIVHVRAAEKQRLNELSASTNQAARSDVEWLRKYLQRKGRLPRLPVKFTDAFAAFLGTGQIAEVIAEVERLESAIGAQDAQPNEAEAPTEPV